MKLLHTLKHKLGINSETEEVHIKDFTETGIEVEDQ